MSYLRSSQHNTIQASMDMWRGYHEIAGRAIIVSQLLPIHDPVARVELISSATRLSELLLKISYESDSYFWVHHEAAAVREMCFSYVAAALGLDTCASELPLKEILGPLYNTWHHRYFETESVSWRIKDVYRPLRYSEFCQTLTKEDSIKCQTAFVFGAECGRLRVFRLRAGKAIDNKYYSISIWPAWDCSRDLVRDLDYFIHTIWPNACIVKIRAFTPSARFDVFSIQDDSLPRPARFSHYHHDGMSGEYPNPEASLSIRMTHDELYAFMERLRGKAIV